MKRKYLASDYTSVIDKVKNRIPNACIGVDVIVGFPGESDADFRETYEFLSQLDISYLHVFTYSDRDNTVSQKNHNKVSQEEKSNRRNLLKRLSAIKYKKFIEKNLNSNFDVLFEKYNDGILSGWTQNYIRVNVESSNNFINQIKTVKLLDNEFINGKLV